MFKEGFPDEVRRGREFDPQMIWGEGIVGTVMVGTVELSNQAHSFTFGLVKIVSVGGGSREVALDEGVLFWKCRFQ